MCHKDLICLRELFAKFVTQKMYLLNSTKLQKYNLEETRRILWIQLSKKVMPDGLKKISQ